jgi:hypothetical protein
VGSRVSALFVLGPSVFAWRTVRAGGQSARGCRPFSGPFRQEWCFSVGGDFCTADRPRPVFRTVCPFSGGQSAAARQTIRSVRRFLLRLFDSFASFLVLPRVL